VTAGDRSALPGFYPSVYRLMSPATPLGPDPRLGAAEP